MPYNGQHHKTFDALLKLWGLPPELVTPISSELAKLDNTRQDELIETFSVQLLKKQNPPQT